MAMTNSERQAAYRGRMQSAAWELDVLKHDMRVINQLIEKSRAIVQQVQSGEKSTQALVTAMGHLESSLALIRERENETSS
ncbi:hypothetical protein Nhal_4011 (plasmid) [Nitrosococcus halophilus Nc 4]|uniref:Uncharacterized protein n=1 Tax=Nitrosococcus halophilus (strain Nc4) TaxID=472759 RepID=D5C5G5_NITHN|nr:hypothetical protein [Nitrosococcus halophilus]ADE17019.1 hypothetical protein Nhal_4011 [Nitrosococcus halophilus Nc 4]